MDGVRKVVGRFRLGMLIAIITYVREQSAVRLLKHDPYAESTEQPVGETEEYGTPYAHTLCMLPG